MSHSISNKDEITKKKKLIIEKSQALGFDVIGFANPKLPRNVKKNLKPLFLKMLMKKMNVEELWIGLTTNFTQKF